MTKKEKKIIITQLFKDIESSKNLKEIEEKITRIINEIYSAEFDLSQMGYVSDSISIFLKSIISAKLETSKDNFIEKSSKTALLTLIDFSKLPS